MVTESSRSPDSVTKPPIVAYFRPPEYAVEITDIPVRTVTLPWRR